MIGGLQAVKESLFFFYAKVARGLNEISDKWLC